jgi:glycosyltransferase involved in cell wall biosynthesis
MSTTTLALFFTRGISLQTWEETGLLEREKLIYHSHLECGNLNQVIWITYGASDSLIAENLKNQGRLHNSIIVCPMPKFFNFFLGSWLYSFLLPLIHFKSINNSQILKTNQIDGSWAAVISKWIFNKPLIIRTGFTQSIFFKKANKNFLVIFLSKLVERFAYKFCDSAIVSSHSDKEYIRDCFKLSLDKINVIHNYIDTEIFKPLKVDKFIDRLVFVGRLNKQKNIHNLLDSISKANLTLDIYGNGDLQEELKLHVEKDQSQVNFKGVVSNSELPAILNRYQYFILPSVSEGMPKALLEAMACSLICVGTNVKGINEVIVDNVNGFLAKNIDNESILEAINKALNCSDRSLITKNARLTIKESFSLESIQKKEMSLLNNLVKENE